MASCTRADPTPGCTSGPLAAASLFRRRVLARGRAEHPLGSAPLSRPLAVEGSAGEEFLLGLRVDGQVPVLGSLSVPYVVDVGVLGSAGAAFPGERGLVEDHGVVVVGQDVVDGDAAHLHAGFLEDLAEKCQHLVAPVVVASNTGVDSCQVMSSSSSAAKAGTSAFSIAS
jgi:hypothetical protein